MYPQVAPSILSADFSNIDQALKLIEDSGAKHIHCDVMDGHFVPQLTFGPKMIADIRKKTKLHLDVHLMISQPELSFMQYIDSGADTLTFHIEACIHAHRLVQQIQEQKVRAGISLVPSTPINHLKDLLFDVDHVLLMSVNPGAGGQKLLPRSYPRLEELYTFRKNNALNYSIAVDGGVNEETSAAVLRSGADLLITGSAFFKAPDKQGFLKKILTKGQ